MEKVVLQFDVNDTEIKEILASTFGDEVTFVERKSFEGLVPVILAIIAVSPQLLEILLKHFASKKSENMPSSNIKRVLIKNQQEISIEGYTEEQVRKLIGLHEK